MLVGAIGLGFTFDDLRHMPLRRLQWFIYAHNQMQAESSNKQESKYREGTVSELKRII